MIRVKMKKILIVILLLNGLLFAQSVRNWQNYSDFKNVVQSCIDQNVIWSATDGGVFAYHFTDSSYQVLTKSEGLISQNITSVAKDANGKIWLGTNEGYIIIYTPSSGEVKTILEIYKTDKPIKSINNILVSGDTAFVSTAFGLSLINTNDFSFIESILKFGSFTTETPVVNILLSNKIYVVTQAGIAVNKAGLTNLSAPESWDNLIINSSTSINKAVWFNNALYAATNRGIYKYQNNQWTLVFLSGSNVLDLVVQNQKLYSIAAEYNSDKTVNKSSLYDHTDTDNLLLSLNSSLFRDINFTEDNNKILVSSSSGLILLDVNNTDFIYPNGPKTSGIIDITVDANNNLWSATGKNGIGVGALKFDGQNWSTVSTLNNDEFISNDVYKVSSSKNAVYFSTWGRGFLRLKENTFQRFDAENTELTGIPTANDFLVINDIKEDENGNAWFLNYWGADKKPIGVLTTEGNIISYQQPNSVSTQIINVENMVIDQYNTKWFSGDLSGDVATEGLFYFNDNGTLTNLSDDVWGKITTTNGLRNRDVRALAIDKFGEIIIGTSVGVDVIPNPSSPTSIRNDQYFSVRQETINSIAVDPINQKWFGTEKGVFLTTSDGTGLLANYTKSNSPLPSDNIKSIAIDENNGTVYIGTDFGLTAISTLFIKPNEDFSDISVYPNPITLSSNTNLNLVIDGLIEDSEIKILDVSGNLINEFRSIGGRTTFWDCKNSNGELIPSGIYIIVAYDSEVNQVGHAKVAVLRK